MKSGEKFVRKYKTNLWWIVRNNLFSKVNQSVSSDVEKSLKDRINHHIYVRVRGTVRSPFRCLKREVK